MAQIYVETVVRSPMARIWALTQDPRQHSRWDLRFTTIAARDQTQVDRILTAATSPAGADPVRFDYRFRLLPGLWTGGVGEYLAGRSGSGGSRTSVLRFRGTDRLALLGEGSGYWRYVPESGGVRFVTGYDYHPQHGRLGRFLDLVLRPVLGWATAWSFDRLRLWLERGTAPRAALLRAWAELSGRLAAAVLVGWLVSPAAGVLALVALAAMPVLPGTPAARRCRRRPPRDRVEHPGQAGSTVGSVGRRDGHGAR